ncbi:hypothetical protein EV702DRAFT_623670 [Suillus placidus]|uniref:Uncharacterized protein n=1 Tax=Suillus placidus TaxID=48579 RepID=A0A9P7CZ84_9AGAM|nr:hypothetical protein EV702DRAFT_623670 [Suillus placidus]
MSVMPHSQDDIRASTVKLSNMMFSASRGSPSPMTPPVMQNLPLTAGHNAHSSSPLTHGRKQAKQLPSPSGLTGENMPSRDSFIFPSGYNLVTHVGPGSLPNIPLSTSFAPSSQYTKGSSHFSAQGSDLSASTSTLDSSKTAHHLSSGMATPRGRDMSYPTVVPSALSVLLSRHADGALSGSPSPTLTHKTDRPPYFNSLADPEQAVSTVNHNSADRTVLATSNVRSEVLRFVSSPATETTPLLPPPNGSVPAINGHVSAPSKRSMSSKRLPSLMHGIIGKTHKIDPQELVRIVLKSLPAVLLGTLLNILDGVSCKPL